MALGEDYTFTWVYNTLTLLSTSLDLVIKNRLFTILNNLSTRIALSSPQLGSIMVYQVRMSKSQPTTSHS